MLEMKGSGAKIKTKDVGVCFPSDRDTEKENADILAKHRKRSILC